MPVPLSLHATSILSAATVLAASSLCMPAPPPADSYRATMRLMAGLLLAAGSLSLSYADGRTFLRNGGNNAFKALYCAGFVSAGAGLSGAASAFYAMDLPLAVSLAAISYSGAGLMLLKFQNGG